MILGDVCTRSCGFCHIATGRPPTLDLDEPRRVGDAVRLMNLKHAVITSVNRDELADGGAAVWAETIRQIRLQSPGTNIEVLIPDFCGDWSALQLVLDEKTRDPQPQHRVRPAPVQGRPPPGQVPPQPRAPQIAKRRG
jgi:lipoic acid synthetase